MHTYAYIVFVTAALQGAMASPKPTETFLGTLPGDNKPCSTPVATTSITARINCDPVCLVPTSVCSAGEPTGPTPNPPVTETLISSGACTATVEVFDNPGCTNCPTCTSAALVARQTTLPGEQYCGSPTTTKFETISPRPTQICACPLALTQCSPGEPSVRPLPTTTLLEGCVEEIIVGPGDCSNVCPTCA